MSAVVDPALPRALLPPGALPPSCARFLDAATRVRLLAARGTLPLPPVDVVLIVYALMRDDDADVAATAMATFASLDERLVGPALVAPTTPAVVLAALCFTRADDVDACRRLLVHPRTPDAGVATIAARSTSAAVLDLIGDAGERLLRSADVVRALAANPRASRATVARAVELILREGVFVADVPAFHGAAKRLGLVDLKSSSARARVDARARAAIAAALDDDEPTDPRAITAARAAPVSVELADLLVDAPAPTTPALDEATRDEIAALLLSDEDGAVDD